MEFKASPFGQAGAMLGVIDEGTRLETGAGNPAVRSTHATHADTTLLQQQRGLAAWDQGRSEHAIPDHAMASEYTSRSELLTHPSTGIYSGNDNGSFYGGCHQLASRLQPYASAPNPETWGLQEDAASKRDAQPHGVMTSAPFAMPLQNHSEALRQHLAMLRHAQRQHAALHLHPHAHRAMQLQHSHPHTPVWPHGAMRGHTADTSNPSLAAWSQRPPSAAGALVPRAGAAAAAPASHLQTTRAATDGSPLSGTDSGQASADVLHNLHARDDQADAVDSHPAQYDDARGRQLHQQQSMQQGHPARSGSMEHSMQHHAQMAGGHEHEYQMQNAVHYSAMGMRPASMHACMARHGMLHPGCRMTEGMQHPHYMQQHAHYGMQHFKVAGGLRAQQGHASSPMQMQMDLHGGHAMQLMRRQVPARPMMASCPSMGYSGGAGPVTFSEAGHAMNQESHQDAGADCMEQMSARSSSQLPAAMHQSPSPQQHMPMHSPICLMPRGHLLHAGHPHLAWTMDGGLPRNPMAMCMQAGQGGCGGGSSSSYSYDHQHSSLSLPVTHGSVSHAGQQQAAAAAVSQHVLPSVQSAPVAIHLHMHMHETAGVGTPGLQDSRQDGFGELFLGEEPGMPDGGPDFLGDSCLREWLGPFGEDWAEDFGVPMQQQAKAEHTHGHHDGACMGPSMHGDGGLMHVEHQQIAGDESMLQKAAGSKVSPHATRVRMQQLAQGSLMAHEHMSHQQVAFPQGSSGGFNGGSLDFQFDSSGGQASPLKRSKINSGGGSMAAQRGLVQHTGEAAVCAVGQAHTTDCRYTPYGSDNAAKEVLAFRTMRTDDPSKLPWHAGSVLIGCGNSASLGLPFKKESLFGQSGLDAPMGAPAVAFTDPCLMRQSSSGVGVDAAASLRTSGAMLGLPYDAPQGMMLPTAVAVAAAASERHSSMAALAQDAPVSMMPEECGPAALGAGAVSSSRRHGSSTAATGSSTPEEDTPSTSMQRNSPATGSGQDETMHGLPMHVLPMHNHPMHVHGMHSGLQPSLGPVDNEASQAAPQNKHSRGIKTRQPLPTVAGLQPKAPSSGGNLQGRTSRMTTTAEAPQCLPRQQQQGATFRPAQASSKPGANTKQNMLQRAAAAKVSSRAAAARSEDSETDSDPNSDSEIGGGFGPRGVASQLLAAGPAEALDLRLLSPLGLPEGMVPELLERVARRGKGGRAPALDPRLQPGVDPKRAARIVANRVSAAKSKLRQKLLSEGLKAKYDSLTAACSSASAELATLKLACSKLASTNAAVAARLQELESAGSLHGHRALPMGYAPAAGHNHKQH